MARLCKVLAAVAAIWFFGSGVLYGAQVRREVTLAIHPQKAPAEPGQFSLLPPEESLQDGDAVPLYEKAARALPDKAGDEQIRKWLEMPIGQLPVEQVEQTLQRYMESLRYVARAAKCRQCNWPHGEPGQEMADQQGFRRLAFVVRLWARLEIARGGYDGAILALQTGFGMGRHLGQAPTILEILTAVGVGGALCIEVEELVQREDSPNLYLALGGLPKPFVNVENAIENDAKEASARSNGRLSREQVKSRLKTDYDRARLVVKRIDVQVAALQCVEAIRLYAGAHGGQLPGALTEVTENPVPRDPVGRELFGYTRTGSTAVLESAIPPGGNERNRVRYEIAIKN